MFCYVCREFIAEAQKRTKTTEIKKIYNQYFDCPLGDQDKLWAPHVVCMFCSSGLRDWYNSRKKYIPFSITMIWREPKAYLTDCYFCKVNITRYSTKNKHKTVYSNLNSAMRLAHHTGSLLIPFRPDVDIEALDDDPDCPNSAANKNYVPNDNDFEPHRFSQAELNDLIKDLFLSKDKRELLLLRLNEKNLLNQGAHITNFRQRKVGSLKMFFCWCSALPLQ